MKYTGSGIRVKTDNKAGISNCTIYNEEPKPKKFKYLYVHPDNVRQIERVIENIQALTGDYLHIIYPYKVTPCVYMPRVEVQYTGKMVWKNKFYKFICLGMKDVGKTFRMLKEERIEKIPILELNEPASNMSPSFKELVQNNGLADSFTKKRVYN